VAAFPVTVTVGARAPLGECGGVCTIGAGDAERERRVGRARVRTDWVDGLLETERLAHDFRGTGAGVCITVMRSGLRDLGDADRRRSA
jgi:hypothetical protein